RLRHRRRARRADLRRRAARARDVVRRSGDRRVEEQHGGRPPGKRRPRRRLRQRRDHDRMTAVQAETGVDRFTLAIIHRALQAASDEMFAAFRKTAMSAIIYEVLDMGTSITDGEGNLASSGAGIPAFVGVLDKAVKRIIEINGTDDIRPGDIFATNDPFYGGVTHLNDVVPAMPVSIDDGVIAWAA